MTRPTLHRRCFVISAIALAAKSLPSVSAEENTKILPDDPRIRGERVTITTQPAGLQCYLARPANDAGKSGSIVVAHDKLGLTPRFENIARRFALEGFVALAPDFASRFGGTPSEPGPALEVVGMATWENMISDTQAALAWLATETGDTARLGAIGYGRGGTLVGQSSAKIPNLAVGVIFYGHVPVADISAIKARLLLNYASEDQFINPDIPGVEDALRKAGVNYELYIYEGTQHAFDDEASGHYNPEAAALAWARTTEFLRSSFA
jgi:carboxymethylenebutenolidase